MGLNFNNTEENKGALIVGCGGIGAHIAMAIREKFPEKVQFIK